jgi:hypothetical protein
MIDLSTTTEGRMMDPLGRFREWLGELLFGPRCEFGCGSRVYPKDRALHRGLHCPVMAR